MSYPLNVSDVIVGDEYEGDDNLLKIIEELKDNIISGKFTEETKIEIYNDISSFVNGKCIIDPKMKNYLFLGWYISNLIECQSQSPIKNLQQT